MIYLLDASVLIALGDANHPHNTAALRFMQECASKVGWATCPLTENAFVRILGQRRIDGIATSPSEVRKTLQTIIATPGHQFWSDDISLMDTRLFPTLPASKDLTDIYLLALAMKHGGRWATFDRRIKPDVLPGGPAGYYQVMKDEILEQEAPPS